MTTNMIEQTSYFSTHPQRERSLDTIQKTIDSAVEDDPANGLHRVSRDIFTDPQIFELEMKHIFEGNWRSR
jgi:hypothetical protein